MLFGSTDRRRRFARFLTAMKNHHSSGPLSCAIVGDPRSRAGHVRPIVLQCLPQGLGAADSRKVMAPTEAWMMALRHRALLRVRRQISAQPLLLRWVMAPIAWA